MRMERTVREIAGDYAVLENESGGTTEVALALLPDGIREGMVLIFENFEYRIKESRRRAMIRHIVMWKFREGEEENREKFLSGLQALDGVIPEIRHMEIHRSCKPGNPYDACLIADFDGLDALSRYKNDPRHVAVSTLCKSIRESRGAIDYEL